MNLIWDIPRRLLDNTFSTQYLESEFASKYNDAEPGSAAKRRSAAIEKWRSIEVKNCEFSRNFVNIDPGYNVLPRVSYVNFIKFARRLVAEVLGDLPDTIVLGNFSGGSSTSRTRRSSEKSGKFVGLADITESAMPFVDVIHREAPLLKQCGSFYHLREVSGAVLFTVPKNADIDRCACKEPDINMFLQKGVGRHIRSRLLRFGQNLNDQTRNRKLACEGSLSGDLATIDLSSASDTVNTVVVKALLPDVWFEYLNDIRSPTVSVDEEIVRTWMFSSMGNGFTFELESLIFWALMKTTAYMMGTPGCISVYGDDIIVPSEGYNDFIWVLSVFGFLPNIKKSFATGPFRESCGGHYHLGEDVTPFYLRKPPKQLTDLIRICNQLRRWAFACPIRRFSNSAVFQLWSELASFVPVEFWGGHDTQVDTQLVSPTPRKSKLVRVSIQKEPCELGRYLAWHCDNWKRTSASIELEVFGSVETSTICRKRRASSAYGRVEEFYEELFPTTISVL
jgi:hypothetical protein